MIEIKFVAVYAAKERHFDEKNVSAE